MACVSGWKAAAGSVGKARRGSESVRVCNQEMKGRWKREVVDKVNCAAVVLFESGSVNKGVE